MPLQRQDSNHLLKFRWKGWENGNSILDRVRIRPNGTREEAFLVSIVRF